MRHILGTVPLLQHFFPTGSVEVTYVQTPLALRGIIPPCYLDCRCPPSGSSKQSWSGSPEFEEFSYRCMNNGIQHHLKESILQKIGEKPGKKCFRLLKQNSNLNILIFAQDFFLGGTGCYLQGTNPTESKKIQVQPGLPGCLGSSKLMMCQMVWVEIIVGPAVKRY